MCRSITQFFVGLLIVVLTVPAVILTVFLANLFNESFYTSGLQRSGLYEAAPQLITEQLQQGFSGFELDGEDIDQEAFLELGDEVLEAVIPAVLDPAFLQDMVESNLKNTFQYLRSEVDELYIYIPKQELLDRINASIDVLVQEVLPAVDFDLPVCSEAEMERLLENGVGSKAGITCVPDFVAEGDISFDKLDNLLQGQLAEALGDFLSGSDNITLSEFFDTFGNSNDEQVTELLANARTYVQYVTIGLMILWIVIAILLAGYYLLGRNGVAARVQALMLPLGVSGALLGLIGLATVSAADTLLFNRIGMAIQNQPELSEVVTELFSYTISTLMVPIAAIGIVLLVVAVTGWVGLHYFPKSDKAKRPSAEA